MTENNSSIEKTRARLRERYNVPYGPRMQGAPELGSSFRGRMGSKTSHYQTPSTFAGMPLEMQLAQVRAEANRRSNTRRMRDITNMSSESVKLAHTANTRFPDRIMVNAFAKFRSTILAAWPPALNSYWAGLAIGERELVSDNWKKLHNEGQDLLVVERAGQPTIVILGVAPTVAESRDYILSTIKDLKPCVVALGLTPPFLPAAKPPGQVDAWANYLRTSWWKYAEMTPSPATIDATLHTKDLTLPPSARWVLQKLANTLSTGSMFMQYAGNLAEARIAADMRTAVAAAGFPDPLALHDDIVAAATSVGATVLRAAPPNAVLGCRRLGLCSYLRPIEPTVTGSYSLKPSAWPYVWAHSIDPAGDEAEQACLRAVTTPVSAFRAFLGRDGVVQATKQRQMEAAIEVEVADGRPVVLVSDIQRLPSFTAAYRSGGAFPFADIAMRGERRRSLNWRSPSRVQATDPYAVTYDLLFSLLMAFMWGLVGKRLWRGGKLSKAIVLGSICVPLWWSFEPLHRLAVSEIDRERWSLKKHAHIGV